MSENPTSDMMYPLHNDSGIPSPCEALIGAFEASGFYEDDMTMEEEDAALSEYLQAVLYNITTIRMSAVKKYPAFSARFLPGHVAGKGTPYGPRPASIMIITKMPGEEEIHNRRHLSGAAGKRLADEMRKNALTLGGCYVTSALKFAPPHDFNSTVPKAWYRECAVLLQQEIRIVRPDYILLLGADALKAVFGNRATLKNYRGSVAELAIPGQTPKTAQVMVANNPADVLRRPEEAPTFSADVARFCRCALGTLEEPTETEVEVIKDIDHLRSKIDELMQYKRFAMDCEWRGDRYTDPNARLLTVQISWAKAKAIVVVLRSDVSNFDFQPSHIQAITELRRLLCREDVSIAGHNFRADMKWLYALGLDLMDQFADRGFDTMLADHLLEENARHALEACTVRHTDMGRYDEEVKQYLHNGTAHSEMPDKVLWQYGGADADATFRLWEVYRAKLWHRHCDLVRAAYTKSSNPPSPSDCITRPEDKNYFPSPFNLFHFIVMPVNRAIFEMEVTGMSVDCERLHTMIGQFSEARSQLLHQLQGMLGDYNFNPRSHAQVSKLLFGDPERVDDQGNPDPGLGLEPVKTTGKRSKQWSEVVAMDEAQYVDYVGWVSRKHSPSTDNESLAILAEEQGSKEAQILRDYRFVDQISKNFLRPGMVDENTGELVMDGGLAGLTDSDGRIRSTFSQLTETGRYRSSAPNLQNLPKAREGDLQRIFKDLGGLSPPPIRSAFKACDGCVLIEADYCSAELWTLASLAEDEVMLDDLSQVDSNGEAISLHTVTAINIFKLDMTPEELEKARKTDSHLEGLRVAAKSVDIVVRESHEIGRL